MPWSAIASLLLALAVALGAFGAHGLKDRLDAYSLGIWEKAVFYHFLHALALLIVPLFTKVGSLPEPAANRISLLLVAGILLFSGSLYILALTGVRTLGAVTPLGGVAFIAAWLYLCVALFQAR
ncbi:DUF423 domain-containing protein [Paludibaculum fermentans]|uniref:DUF423 domain-containing protein n=1 Tax=Paludibaculum fermentans TaxID=1473598 RepID=A0A7S7SIS4_PALFE|nr:DUF423 domain-containing protein [Paludibaculum fermentans]QOY87337.1 DUF423 domain-containing protein [Paludibaculum fermentans]